MAQLCDYTKTQSIVCTGIVNYMLYGLHLNKAVIFLNSTISNGQVENNNNYSDNMCQKLKIHSFKSTLFKGGNTALGAGNMEMNIAKSLTSLRGHSNDPASYILADGCGLRFGGTPKEILGAGRKAHELPCSFRKAVLLALLISTPYNYF